MIAGVFLCPSCGAYTTTYGPFRDKSTAPRPRWLIKCNICPESQWLLDGLSGLTVIGSDQAIAQPSAEGE